MDVTCSAVPCPVILSSTCVFYTGANLIYTGITNNDNLEIALQKIDAKFQDAGLGYIFQNGIIQLGPGLPVGLGGSLTQNTLITGAYRLSLSGEIEASKLITTGGSSSQFVKGDGSLDSTPFQPSGNYISSLSGDGVASGPGASVFTLANTGVIANTYGSATRVPIITVDAKGRVTNLTSTLIAVPSSLLLFGGDVTGSGNTGSSVVLTLQTVNPNIYPSNTFLKFAVNGKGLVTSAAPITNLDIESVLGYIPVPNSRTITINGVTQDLANNRSWTVDAIFPSLISGSVLFSDGTTIAQDNANFFWDNTNNRLGIGNNSPAYPLDVTGVIRGSSDALINGLTIGRGSGNSNTNTALGVNALLSNSTGVSNVAVGATSMINNTIGQQNTAVGYISLAANTEGNYNTAVGFWAMRDNTLGNFNTSLGISSGRSITTGSNNITIGYLSGNGITTGSGNTIIGRASGLFPFLSNTVIIADGGGSYRFYSPSSGNILFGSTTDSGQKLQVTGTAIISGTTTLSSLSGVGARMVVADALGELSTAAIPVGTVTSVGLSMPTAFTVTNSPVTGAGTLTVTGAGTASQYVRGDGALAAFPSSPSGGGSSIGYYLNGSVAASVAGYEQLSRTPVFGVGTDFTTSTDGLIAQFLTDVGDPSFLNIPGGAWLVDLYFNADSAGGSPDFYVELLKYDGVTFTLLSSSVTNAEVISNGTAVDLYITSLSVPTTTLTLTDRLAIRVYVDCDGKTLTLHTEGDNLSQVITTFSTGISTLNGLVDQVQYFGVGTTGTDFNISSATNTHTFNLPTASATNRGALSSTDWTTFNGKQNALTNPVTGTGVNNEIAYFNTTGSTISSLPTATYPSLTELSYVKGVTSSIQTQLNNKFTLPSLTAGSVLFSNGTTIAQDNSNFFWNDTNNRLGIGTNTPASSLNINTSTSFDGLIVNQVGSANVGSIVVQQGTNTGGSFNAYGPLFSINHLRDRVGFGANKGLIIFSDAPLGSGGTNDVRIYAGGYDANQERLRVTSGGVSIGSVANPAASAILDITSTTKGFLPPRMSTTNRGNIIAPATGLQIYNTTTNTNQYYNGTNWRDVSPITVQNSGSLFSTGLSGTGVGATIFANNSNFFGVDAGYQATAAFSSNFFGEGAGYQATYSSNSNFIGGFAGESATLADSSNFIGVGAGIGATNASYSNFFGAFSGAYSPNAANSIFIGREAGTTDAVNNTTNGLSSILIGSYTNTGGFSNSILLGSGIYGSAISNTKANQFMLADTITDVRWRGIEYTLPASQAATAGQVLSNNGSGVLSWVAGGSGGAFIPLSGTLSGSPVTGNIRTTNDYGVWKQYTGVSDETKILSTGVIQGTTTIPSSTQAEAVHTGHVRRYYDGVDEQTVEIAESILESSAYINFSGTVTRGKIYAQSFSAPNNNYGYSTIIVDADQGLIGAADYSGSYSANSYIQKSYVDGVSSPVQIRNTTSLFSTALSAGAGSTATSSIFLGENAGEGANGSSVSVYIGLQAGYLAAGNNGASICLGSQAGWNANGIERSIFIGNRAGLQQTGINNIIIGTNIALPANTTNAINIGNVLYGVNTYSTFTGAPSIVPTTTGRIGIGVVTPNASARLDVSSTSHGILIPRMTLTQRNNIATPAAGLQVVVTGETGGEILSMRNSSTSSWIALLDDDPDIKLMQGLGSLIKAQTYKHTEITTTTSLQSGIVRFIAVYLSKAQTITGVQVWQNPSGSFTATNNNKVGLYTVNPATGVLTRVAQSNNDVSGNIWKTVNLTRVAFNTPYVAKEGVYFIALLYNASLQTFPPALASRPVFNLLVGPMDNSNGLSPVMLTVSTQTDLSTTYTRSSELNGNSTNNIWASLY